MEQDLEVFQIKLGYRFNQVDLLERALSHRSAGADHNERLEFLGDSVVDLAIAEALFKQFPNSPEGDLSAKRSLLVCRESLADIARDLSLGDFLKLGEGTSKTGGHRLDSILADAYEALLGALYLDAGWSYIVEIVHLHFSSKFQQLSEATSVRDAKSRLQEWLQASKHPLPTYELLDIDGPGHAQRFRIRCQVDVLSGEFIGEGSNRRKAEQMAAQTVLDVIEQDDE